MAIQEDTDVTTRMLHQRLGNGATTMQHRMGNEDLLVETPRGPIGSPFECESRSGSRSGFGGGLYAWIVLEELLVDLGVLLPLGRQLIVDEDRLDGAHRFTRATVDALIRMDVEHRLALVDAIHGTDFHAGLVLDIDAGFRDHVRHSDLPITHMSYPAHARVRKPDYFYQLVPLVSSCRQTQDGPLASSERAEFRVESVPKRIAEEIEGEHGQADGQAGEQPHPRCLLGKFDGRSPQHQTPCRRRFLDAESEEGQRCFEQNGLP